MGKDLMKAIAIASLLTTVLTQGGLALRDRESVPPWPLDKNGTTGVFFTEAVSQNDKSQPLMAAGSLKTEREGFSERLPVAELGLRQLQ